MQNQGIRSDQTKTEPARFKRAGSALGDRKERENDQEGMTSFWPT